MEEMVESSDTQSSAPELTTDALSPQQSTVNTTQQGKKKKTKQIKTRSRINFLFFELPQKQPLLFVSSEFKFEPQEEVPDFSVSVEVGDFNMCHRFEVSPEHSPGETLT